MPTESSPPAPSPDEVQQVAAERCRLLSLKHAGQASPEDLASLEALNRRMGELCPRVTPEQWQALEEAKQLLDTMQQRRTERDERLEAGKS